jgi:hypothetical protein
MFDITGTDWFAGLLMLTPLLQAIAFLIETSSWLVRSQSTSADLGLYVGRSNIYLYSSRMFTLVFTASLAFAVESGESMHVIFTIIYTAFFLSAAIHAVLMFDVPRQKAMHLIAGALLLPRRGPIGHTAGIHVFGNRLFWLTTGTSIIFSLSLTAPILGAILLPEFRLSISYVGQLINFFGTIIILFFVDQILFKAIDARQIDEIIMSYVAGRLAGFVLIGLVFVCIGLNI